jgi:hypothetical protein
MELTDTENTILWTLLGTSIGQGFSYLFRLKEFSYNEIVTVSLFGIAGLLRGYTGKDLVTNIYEYIYM